MNGSSGEHEFYFDKDMPERLDRFVETELSSCGENLSRTEIQRRIRGGDVQINGAVEQRPGRKLRTGDAVALCLVQTQSRNPTPTPYDLELAVIYEDSTLVVIDKPAGLTMHPGSGNTSKTLLNALVSRYGAAILPTAARRFGIVHRLDKDTSGVVVVALSSAAHEHLSAQFAARTTTREYLGLVVGSPRRRLEIFESGRGTLSGNIARSEHDRRKMSVAEHGRRAVTHFEVLEHFSHALLLRFRLETGRTHQIRVHCAQYGAPLIGDPVYGADERLPQRFRLVAARLNRQALHARTLGFVHPVTNKEMFFESELPSDLKLCIDQFRGSDG